MSLNAPVQPPKKLSSGLAFHGPLDFAIHPESLKKDQIPTFSVDSSQIDQFWMYEAFCESLKNAGLTNPNPAVGCILVSRQGLEIARGTTQSFPGLHAERVAFSQVKDRHSLEEATAYITLEPCTHHGHQPPCIDLLLNSPLKRVVIARADTDPRVAGQGIQALRQAGKQVEIGLFHQEVTAWNFGFFAGLNLKRPIFCLKWAQTLDGQLADDSDSSQWISNSSSRAYTHWMRQRHDAILIGAQTLIHDQPRLNVRDCHFISQHQPIPIIWDPQGRLLPLSITERKTLWSKLQHSERKIIYITEEGRLPSFARSADSTNSHSSSPSSPAASDIKTSLFPELIDPSQFWIIELPVSARSPAPRSLSSHSSSKFREDLIEKLQSPDLQAFLGKKLQSIFVEGGAQTLKAFLETGLADSVHTFIAPIMTGGQKHRITLGKSLKEAHRLEVINIQSLGRDTLLEMVSAPLYKDLFCS